MTMLASLSNRIFLASVLLAVVSLGFSISYIGLRVVRQAEAALERGLYDTSALVEQQRAYWSASLLREARLVADLPKLKAAVATADLPTVEPLARDYQRQLGADLLEITGAAGARLLSSGRSRQDREATRAVERALGGREDVSFWPHPGGVLEVVTVPIAIGRDPAEVLGTLSVGVLLDGRRAEAIKRTTQAEVAFGDRGEIRASTLPPSAWPALAPLLAHPHTSHVTLGGEEFVALARPLGGPAGSAGGPDPITLVLKSRTEQLRPVRTTNRVLLATGAASLLLATLVSFAVARTITRPLADITAAMREMAATGDLTRKIALRGSPAWQDEDARLLATTFNTLTDSIARFQREAALRDRLLALGRLSTVIAHEVRNPLMIIKAAVRTVRAGSNAADVAEAVTDIDGEVDRINRIVTDVLDFARPPRLDVAPADAAAICRSAAEAVRADGAWPPVTVEAPAAAPVVTDSERLRTALVNLLTNARQAVLARPVSPANDPPPVLLRLAADGHGLRLAVCDRGVGIAADELPHIFEPYYSTRRAGTGLGLPIARNIIEGLGGAIEVTSSESGTTVEVRLPATPAGPAPGTHQP